MAWVTHSLGCAVAATALVASASSTARGQSPEAQTQEPSRPPVFGNLSLFDDRLTDRTKPIFVEQPGLSGVVMTCIGCRGFETTAVRPESANETAPWAVQGKWSRQTTFGVVSTGFVGVRNYALPLETAIPLGGDLDPNALRAAGPSIFPPVPQWSLTAGVDKTLAKRRSGATVGVTGDVLIPINTETISADDPRKSALTSPTVRLGIVFRW